MSLCMMITHVVRRYGTLYVYVDVECRPMLMMSKASEISPLERGRPTLADRCETIE